MSQSILVPVDGSDHARDALEFAIATAKAFGDDIILLNVQLNFQTRNTIRFFSVEQIQEYTDQLAKEALEESEQILKKSGVPYRTKVRSGIPKSEISLEAQESGARCIVMGSRGMGPVIGKVLGSVSYGILHDAPCPVILVP